MCDRAKPTSAPWPGQGEGAAPIWFERAFDIVLLLATRLLVAGWPISSTRPKAGEIGWWTSLFSARFYRGTGFGADCSLLSGADRNDGDRLVLGWSPGPPADRTFPGRVPGLRPSSSPAAVVLILAFNLDRDSPSPPMILGNWWYIPPRHRRNHLAAAKFVAAPASNLKGPPVVGWRRGCCRLIAWPAGGAMPHHRRQRAEHARNASIGLPRWCSG